MMMAEKVEVAVVSVVDDDYTPHVNTNTNTNNNTSTSNNTRRKSRTNYEGRFFLAGCQAIIAIVCAMLLAENVRKIIKDHMNNPTRDNLARLYGLDASNTVPLMLWMALSLMGAFGLYVKSRALSAAAVISFVTAVLVSANYVIRALVTVHYDDNIYRRYSKSTMLCEIFILTLVCMESMLLAQNAACLITENEP